MKYNPHKYQKVATDFILQKDISAILLEMGLGKSIITLTAINELMLDRFDVSKVLIIAPLRVAQSTWKDEINKWEHLSLLDYSIVVGSKNKRLEALSKKAHIYIINRENIEWLITKSGYKFDFDMVVIDELSSFKNGQSKRFKALSKIRPRIKRIVGLTGTPSSNGLMDLWAEFKILDMGVRLEKYITHYRNKYFIPDKRNGMQIYSWKPQLQSEEKIYDKISDITISMKAKDHLKLPKLVINEVKVSMNDKETKLYKELKEEFIVSLVDRQDTVYIDAVNAAVLSGKLLQLASGSIYDENKNSYHIHDRKLDALEDLIEGANGKPVLIAYWFKHDLERIKKRFDIREIKSAKDISDWNEGNIPVALIHPVSAGHGLNLQAGGSTLIWFGLTWSLELYQQTNARIYRQGQDSTVIIHHIITKGTIDEDVMKALKSKEKVQDALINSVKARLK